MSRGEHPVYVTLALSARGHLTVQAMHDTGHTIEKAGPEPIVESAMGRAESTASPLTGANRWLLVLRSLCVPVAVVSETVVASVQNRRGLGERRDLLLRGPAKTAAAVPGVLTMCAAHTCSRTALQCKASLSRKVHSWRC